MSAAPLELAWWGVRWGGVGDGQRQTEQGITLLELGKTRVAPPTGTSRSDRS